MLYFWSKHKSLNVIWTCDQRLELQLNIWNQILDNLSIKSVKNLLSKERLDP